MWVHKQLLMLCAPCALHPPRFKKAQMLPAHTTALPTCLAASVLWLCWALLAGPCRACGLLSRQFLQCGTTNGHSYMCYGNDVSHSCHVNATNSAGAAAHALLLQVQDTSLVLFLGITGWTLDAYSTTCKK